MEMKFKNYCEVCGVLIKKEINRNWNEYKKKKYCSRKCTGIGIRKAIIVVCLHCGKEIERAPSHIQKKIFCSQSCRSQYARYDVKCIGCGKMFKHKPSATNNKYCSWECFKQSRWEEVVCVICGKVYQKRLCEIQKGYKHLCSRSCRNSYTSLFLGGDGTWSSNKHNPKRFRGKDWNKNRKLTLIRDNYTCQQCGATERLEVHHWEPFWISYDNSVDNLVVFCKQCHDEKYLEYKEEGFYDDVRRDLEWGSFQNQAGY